jgi:3',5'-cyclic AMP phosphodiesterase CpdA
MFVLAHLSDPHLGPVPLPRFRELTGKRALGFVNWHRRRFVRHRPEALEALVHDLRSAAPDHIAVTGDLVNIALEKEFPPAREWLAQLGSPHDVSMVPGNHDAYVRDAIEHPASHWGDYMRGDGIGTGAPHSRSGPFPYVRRRGPAALIGLSTALPTAPFLATGKLGADQLMRLSDALAHLAHEGLFRIVLIHHPPAAQGRNRFKRLIDAGPFLRLIAEYGAELVLHGHNHVHSLAWIEGPEHRIPVVGVPSASAAVHGDRDPAGYNLYRIHGAPGCWRCEVISRGLKAGHGGLTELSRRALVQ